ALWAAIAAEQAAAVAEFLQYRAGADLVGLADRLGVGKAERADHDIGQWERMVAVAAGQPLTDWLGPDILLRCEPHLLLRCDFLDRRGQPPFEAALVEG